MGLSKPMLVPSGPVEAAGAAPFGAGHIRRAKPRKPIDNARLRPAWDRSSTGELRT
jgi:hypothetical protein